MTSAPIQTGINRTDLDPNNPATLWFNPGVLSNPGNFELGSAAQYHSKFRNPPILDERLGIQKRMRFPIRGDRNIDLIYRAERVQPVQPNGVRRYRRYHWKCQFRRPTGPQVGARLITMGLRLNL